MDQKHRRAHASYFPCFLHVEVVARMYTHKHMILTIYSIDCKFTTYPNCKNEQRHSDTQHAQSGRTRGARRCASRHKSRPSSVPRSERPAPIDPRCPRGPPGMPMACEAPLGEANTQHNIHIHSHTQAYTVIHSHTQSYTCIMFVVLIMLCRIKTNGVGSLNIKSRVVRDGLFLSNEQAII